MMNLHGEIVLEPNKWKFLKTLFGEISQ